MKKRNVIAGLLAVFVVLGTSSVAMAGTSYPASLSMNYSRASGGQFTGKISSRSVCASTRRVVVYRKGGGSIGSTTTSGAGSWRLVTGKPSRGDYYATTAPKAAGPGIRCGGATSALTHVS